MVWWAPLLATGASAVYDKYTRDQAKKEAGNQADPFADIPLPTLEAIAQVDPEYAGDIEAKGYKAATYDPALRGPAKTIDPDLLPKMEAIDYIAQQGEAAQYDPTTRDRAHTMTAGQADVSQQGPTAMGQISTDPRLEAAQLAALDSLTDIGESGGLTAIDRADLDRAQDEIRRSHRNRLGAIQQNMAMRGLSGSGMEQIAALQAAQDATEREQDASLQINALAKQRALDAIMSGAQLGGNIRGQSFGEQSKVRSAEDAINRFNVGNMNTMSQFNVGQQNQAAAANMAARNQLDAMNMAAQNQAGQYNTSAQNAMQAANLAAANQAARYRADVQNAANQFNTGSAIGAQQYNVGAQNQRDRDIMAAQNQALQFGAGAQNTANQWSAGQQNQAAASNRAAQQNYLDNLTNVSNYNRNLPNQLAQQNFQNQMAKAGATFDTQGRNYDRAQDTADRRAKTFENVVRSGTQAYQNWDPDKPKKKKMGDQ